MTNIINIKIKINFLVRLLLFSILLTANTTGIISYFTNDIVAEGIVILLAFILTFFLLIYKKKFSLLDYSFIFVAFYSIFVTLFNCFINGVSLKVFISFYYYLIPCLIFLNRKNPFLKENTDFFFFWAMVFLCINSLYAIYQTFNPTSFLQLDGIRARGLMKSTLNYSGILGAFFYCIILYKTKFTKFKILTLLSMLVGGFLSMSKGLFINLFLGFLLSFPTQLLFFQRINKKILFTLNKFFLFIPIILLFVIYLFVKYDLFEYFQTLLAFVNFKTDQSNIDRYNYWINIIPAFLSNPLGYGIGQISSGTTFVDKAVNFESYIFDSIYMLGIVSFVYFYIPIKWIIINLKKITFSKKQQLLLMFFIGICIQNLIQASMLTPATLIITWFNIVLLPIYLNKGFENENMD